MKPGENNRRAEERNGRAECGGTIGKVGKVWECPGNGGKVRRRNRSGGVELSVNLITVIKYYQHNYKLSVCKEICASLSRCLTSIRTRIVSGIKLAQRKEIVSLPPEKMHSTATAEPAVLNLVLKVTQHEGDSILTRDGKHITNKLIEVWEL